MKVFRLLGLSTVLAILLGLVGCFDETVKKDQKADIPELDQLLSALQDTELEIAQGFLFQHASPHDRYEFKATLYDAQIAALRLQKNPQDGEALNLLYDSFRIYAGLKLQEEDGYRLEELAQILKRAIEVVAEQQGKQLNGLARQLYVKDFNFELAPFASFTKLGKDGWKKTNFKENHYAAVSGSKITSWLFSPRFDLTAVDEPAFVLEQAINARGASYQGIVSFLVSTDYVGGDPETAVWDTLIVQRLPDGSGFASVRTEDVSLAAYKGKKIVIAFRYDTTAVNSFPTWQITEFQLKGTGELQSQSLLPAGGEKIVSGEQPALIYNKKFNSNASEALSPFMALNRAGTWKMNTAVGKFFAEGKALLDPADKKKSLPSDLWLFSPKLDLAAVEKPSLVLLQTIRADRPSTGTEVLVSSDFDGQAPEKVQWTRLKIQNMPSGANFTPVETEMIDLSAWQGKSITIAFHIKTDAVDNQLVSWQIENFTIYGKGSELKNLSPTAIKDEARASTRPAVPTPGPQPVAPVGPALPTQPSAPVAPTPDAQPSVPLLPTPDVQPSAPLVPTADVQPSVPLVPTPDVQPVVPVAPAEYPEVSVTTAVKP